MGYSPTDVLKQFVKSNGDKCSKIDDIYTHVQAKTYRAPFAIDGTDLSARTRVVDIVAIGLNRNWLRPNQLDPIVLSLDWYTLDSLKLKANKTFADTDTNYFSNSTPLYQNYSNGAKTMASILIKNSDLVRCNAYINGGQTHPFVGGYANNNSNMNIIPKNFDYWSANEKNLSNYSRDSDAMDKTGVSTLNMLFYTTDIVNELQTRLGYRVPNNLDPYHWSNWICSSANATAGGGDCVYYKIMYLTEFDFYMHSGAIANPSRIDIQLAKSVEFSRMLIQIMDPSENLNMVSSTFQYYLMTNLIKGSVFPAGQYIYSKDYQYKLHLSQDGNLRVYKFPILDDNINLCQTQALTPSAFTANADNIMTCYLVVGTDGNIAVYANPGTTMQNDPNYAKLLAAYTPATGFSKFANGNNTAIVILGDLASRNKLGFSNVLPQVDMYRMLINKNSLNICNMMLSYPYAKDMNISGYTDKPIANGVQIASSGTGGNGYFAMDDYQLIVNAGGALTAVNAGVSSKVGTDQASYVAGANNTNWQYTDDPMNLQCIHGWKYVKADGTGVPDLKQITSITIQGDTKNWCYQNPFLMYAGSDGVSYKFSMTKLQQILWYVGPYVNNIDSIYAFLKSNVISRANDLGYNGGISINSDNGKLIAMNYCMRGDRWMTNGQCRSDALNNTYGYSTTLKSLIDYDIKARLCAAPSGSGRIFCAIANPSGLSTVETSLIALDPDFVYATNNLVTTNSGTYGAPSSDDRLAIITKSIEKNAASLTEDQLLYLRRFYNVYYTDTRTIYYTPNNTFIYRNIYHAAQGAIIYSPNKLYSMVFQTDGNLVIYTIDATTGKSIKLIWNSSTSINPLAVLLMDTSGNVIIYSNPSLTTVLWTTGISKFDGPTALTVDNNGMAVLLGMSGPNNIWAPIWTGDGLSKYVTTPVMVLPTINLLDESKWSKIYQTTMKFTPLPGRTDIPGLDKNLPYGKIVYKNGQGTIIIHDIMFDVNTLRSLGKNLTTDPLFTFASNDIVWKYILGYLNSDFPKQLLPLGVNEFVNTLPPAISASLTGSNAPFETQIWNMSGATGTASVGNILVWRLTSLAKVVNFMRSGGSTFKTDSIFKSTCASAVDNCVPEYSAIISDPSVDITSIDYNTICDIADVNNAVTSMKADPSYNTIITTYSPSNVGFAANRTIAINIITKYMTANNITSGPLNSLSDAQLYAILTGSTTGSAILNKYSGTFSATNTSAIRSLCVSAFGLKKCTDPTLRYKSSFSNKDRFDTKKIQRFSGASCINVCNDLSASADILAACKKGSLDYCAQSDNIFDNNCTADLTKYSELALIKSSWCDNNKTHANFAKNCTKPLTTTTTSGTAGGAPSAAAAATSGDSKDNPAYQAPTQSTTQNNDLLGGIPIWGWIAIFILVIMLGGGIIAILGIRKNNRVQSVSRTAIAPIPLPPMVQMAPRVVLPAVELPMVAPPTLTAPAAPLSMVAPPTLTAP